MIILSSPNASEFNIFQYSEAICFIYNFLWKEHECTSKYKGIIVNLIGSELEEVIIPVGKDIYINVRYSDQKAISERTELEKQTFCLEILQTGLSRLAEKDKTLDITKLDLIKEKILEQKFDFEIAYKTFLNKNNADLVAKVIVHPLSDRFEFYITISEKEINKCRLHIYRGKPTDYYIQDFFSVGKWKGDKFILTGKGSEIEFHVSPDCKVELINVGNQKDKAPLFEAMKANADKEKTLNDYLASLDPHIAAALRNQS